MKNKSVLTVDNKKDTQKISLTCPNCEKNFSVEKNMNEIRKGFSVNCPYCGGTNKIHIESESWTDDSGKEIKKKKYPNKENKEKEFTDKQKRMAEKIYSMEGFRNHSHVRRLKKKLAKSLHENGYSLQEISKIIHSKPSYTQGYINEGWDFDAIGEDDIVLFVFGFIGVIFLSAFIGWWFFPVGTILLIIIKYKFLD